MIIDRDQFSIETERLLLVPISHTYVNEMFVELTDEITKYLTIYSPKTLEEEIKFVNESIVKMDQGTDLILMILDKIINEYIGNIGLHNINTKSPEFGIWTKKSAHGKKIGREAITGLLEWANNQEIFDYYIYKADKANIPSRKIAESFGGVFVSEDIREFPSEKILD